MNLFHHKTCKYSNEGKKKLLLNRLVTYPHQAKWARFLTRLRKDSPALHGQCPVQRTVIRGTFYHSCNQEKYLRAYRHFGLDLFADDFQSRYWFISVPCVLWILGYIPKLVNFAGQNPYITWVVAINRQQHVSRSSCFMSQHCSTVTGIQAQLITSCEVMFEVSTIINNSSNMRHLYNLQWL